MATSHSMSARARALMVLQKYEWFGNGRPRNERLDGDNESMSNRQMAHEAGVSTGTIGRMKSKLRSRDGAMYSVYFITDGEYVKIGTAGNMATRISNLQTGNARELNLVKEIPCETKNDANDLEKHFHEVFAHLHVRGEWFDSAVLLDDKGSDNPLLHT